MCGSSIVVETVVAVAVRNGLINLELLLVDSACMGRNSVSGSRQYIYSSGRRWRFCLCLEVIHSLSCHRAPLCLHINEPPPGRFCTLLLSVSGFSAKMSAKHEPIYFEPNVAANKQKLQRVQDIMSLALGVSAGILGLESLYGFLFFLVGFSLSNLGFFLECCKGEAQMFFISPFRQIFFDGFVGGLSGYVMMWCLTYALVN